jgi:hypothetical protein
LDFVNQKFGSSGLLKVRIAVLFFDLLSKFGLDFDSYRLLVLHGPPNRAGAGESDGQTEEDVLF